MGFQQIPALPDYSKLITSLNESNVQKWNPALYQILKNLIGAVGQSQDVIVNNASDILNLTGGGGTGLTSVAVDPAGALAGDGTVPTPLKVLVDGTTVIISADKLTAVSPTPIIFLAGGSTPFSSISPSGSGTIPAHTVFGTIPGVGGKTIWPLITWITYLQSVSGVGGQGAWNSGITFEAVYNSAFSGYAGPIYTGSLQLFTTNLTTNQGTQIVPAVGNQTATSALGAFQGSSLSLRTSNVGAVNGSTNATGTMINTGTWSMAYLLF